MSATADPAEVFTEWQEWRCEAVVGIETVTQIVSRLCDEITVLRAEVAALGAALADMNAELTRLRIVNTLREVER
jgi:hypothetical protein